ncbi:MAG: hypothetical protein HY074_03555 [Deltaproteobacteria bacterium]|nr:hypothetical protein [Deltaproteobacteria bacterium]
MTSSSSSFNTLFVLLLFSVPAWAAQSPLTVEIPTQAFGRYIPAPIHGYLWTSQNKTEATRGRSVALVPPPEAASSGWHSTAEFLSEAGFDVLLVEPRKGERQYQRTLLEDLQSGVLFLKADPRVQAQRVSLIGSEAAANTAAHYAGANSKMALVLDSLVLISPDKLIKTITFFDALEKIKGIPVLLLSSKPAIIAAKKICKTSCRSLASKETGQGIVARKAVLEFLLRPHG